MWQFGPGGSATGVRHFSSRTLRRQTDQGESSQMQRWRRSEVQRYVVEIRMAQISAMSVVEASWQPYVDDIAPLTVGSCWIIVPRTRLSYV